MSTEVLRLMGTHSCFRGLDEDALADIAEHIVVVRYEINECVHPANTPLTDIYLIVQGSLKATYPDFQGNEKLFRIMSRDDQFGILSAALDEPLPATVVARQPAILLKLDYEKAKELTARHATLRLNLLQSLSNSLRQVFFEDKSKPQPTILAVFHSSPATRAITQRLVRRLVQLGEQPYVLSDSDREERVEGVTYRLLGDGNRKTSVAEIREKISQSSKSTRVFIDVDATTDPALAARLIDLSDAVIWCLQPPDHEATADRMKAVGIPSPEYRENVNLVWLLDGDSQFPPVAPELLELAGRDFKLTFAEPRSPQGMLLANGLERLVHYLRGVKIGLALGGGAARGMAHLGILQILEQNGIVVDMIAGTSVGAMTGIMYASGLDADYNAQCFASDLKPSWPFRWMPRGNHWYLLYKYRLKRFDGMLRKYLSQWTLEQLPLPCCSVTVDLISGDAVIRDRGDAVHAILESINLPVLSAPIYRNGQALIDGGLVKNIPADVLVQSGCNFVIAVSVTAEIEHEFAKNHSDTPTSRMKRASTLQTLMRSFLVQSMNMNSIGVRPADVVLEPDVTQFDLTEFMRAEELAAIGKQTAVAELATIRGLLKQLDAQVFAEA